MIMYNKDIINKGADLIMAYFDITYNPAEKREVIELREQTKAAVRYSNCRVTFRQDDDIIILDIDELLDLADHVRSQIEV